VNSARKQLLAGASFANQQNGDAAARCYLSRKCDYFAECRTLTNDVRVPTVRRRLLRSD